MIKWNTCEDCIKLEECYSQRQIENNEIGHICPKFDDGEDDAILDE